MFQRLSILLLVLFLFNCKKEDELVIENIENKESEISRELDDEAHKPLIHIKADDKISILVRGDGAPGMYLGEDGDVHGFYVDLERMVMNEMNQKYEFIAYDDLGPVVIGIKTGVYHLALAAPYSPDYVELVNLSKPFERLNYVTFVHKNSSFIKKSSSKDEVIKSLYGKKVGVQVQGHIYQILREHKEIDLVEYETTTKALEALNSGLLDAVPDVKRIGIYYSKMNNWEIIPVGDNIISFKIGTAFSKAIDNDLIERYNSALDSIINDGRLEELWEKYYGPMGEDNRP